MGLLDNVLGSSFDDPRTAATLQLAQGLLSSPRVMQGLAGGLSGYQQAMAQAKQAKALEEYRAMQMQQMRSQMEAQKRAEAFRASIPSPQFQIGQEALAANGGFKGATAPLPKADPNQELLFGAMRAGIVDPLQYIQSTTKETGPMITKAGDVARDRRTGKVLWQNDDKDSVPAEFKLYQLSGAPERGITYDQWDLQRRKASAQTLNVNTGDRIPATLVKEQDAMLDRVFNAQAIDADLSAIENQIRGGKLKFGPVENFVSQGKNLLGVSDEQSRNYASFKTTLEKLRNDSLRLNTGVQTDGDAQREWNALFQNINDTTYVRERLAEIRKINQRGARLQRERLNILRRNSGAGALDLPNVEPAIGGGSKVVDFNDL